MTVVFDCISFNSVDIALYTEFLVLWCFNASNAFNLTGVSCSTLLLQGYLFISVLVNSNSELIRLINNAIKNDLSSRNPTFMCLALHCIANVGSREMAEAFASEIPRILVAGLVGLLLLRVEELFWFIVFCYE